MPKRKKDLATLTLLTEKGDFGFDQLKCPMLRKTKRAKFLPTQTIYIEDNIFY
jgi:hypothetical protein